MKKILLALVIFINTLAYGADIRPLITYDVLSKAKFNDYWKVPKARGEHLQVVFMSVSQETNPNNEIGEETHEFDQIILIVEGQAEANLNGEISPVTVGDMLIIPKGTPHNLKNLNASSALKLISIYGEQDIPDTIFKTKKDEIQQF